MQSQIVASDQNFCASVYFTRLPVKLGMAFCSVPLVSRIRNVLLTKLIRSKKEEH